MNHKQPDIHLISGSRGMLAAKQPLVVPMLLRLSHFKLSSYVVLVVSKQKGITLVFKTDPLQNVDINSSFDSIAVIQKFIQREIEGQLRQMFREDLPGIIHRLSQQWVKSKVEAPYLSKRHPLSQQQQRIPRQTFDTMSAPDLSSHQVSPIANVGLQPHIPRPNSLGSMSYGRARSSSGLSTASTNRSSTRRSSHPIVTPSPVPHPDSSITFPDLESFDPTYGLRPEGLPTKSVFTSFGRLFSPNRGLADLAEEDPENSYEEEGSSTQYDYDESGSFDVVNWEDTVPDLSPPPTVSSENDNHELTPEYETIPAVGGGTITRPRVYHSQSMIQTPSDGSTATTMRLPKMHKPSPQLQAQAQSSNTFELPRNAGLTQAALEHHHRQPQSVHPRSMMFDMGLDAAAFRSPTGPTMSPNSVAVQQPRSSNEMTQSDSISSSSNFNDAQSAPLSSGSPKRSNLPLNLHDIDIDNPDYLDNTNTDRDPQIVLRPLLNNSIHQLSTLSHSNHTLSPYTRSLAHFTVRSVPPRGAGNGIGVGTASERFQPLKAKRRRTYRLGGNKSSPPAEAISQPVDSDSPSPPSPTLSSEFNASDMDRYFRTHDDLTSHSPEHHSTHVRQRPLYRSHE